MFEVPGSDITAVHIHQDHVLGKSPPHYERLTTPIHSDLSDCGEDSQKSVDDVLLERSAVEAEQ